MNLWETILSMIETLTYSSFKSNSSFLDNLMGVVGISLFFILILIFLMLLILLVGFIYIWVYIKTLKYKTRKIELTVVNKFFKKEKTWTQLVYAGNNIFVPIIKKEPEKYIIELFSKELNYYYEIDDENLYSKIKKKDIIKASVKIGYNNKKELKYSEIETYEIPKNN